MNVPMEDVEELWKASDKTWEGLEKTLQARKDKAEGVEDAIVDHMLAKAMEKKAGNEAFPETAKELYEIMNEDADDADDLVAEE